MLALVKSEKEKPFPVTAEDASHCIEQAVLRMVEDLPSVSSRIESAANDDPGFRRCSPEERAVAFGILARKYQCEAVRSSSLDVSVEVIALLDSVVDAAVAKLHRARD